jgi:hypothetical protein
MISSKAYRSISPKTLGFLLLVGSLQPLCAQVLIDDTFNRGTADSPVTLAGTTPTQTGGTAAGATWTVQDGTATTNGSGALFSAPASGDINTYVQLAPAGASLVANSVYTVSIVLPQFTADGGDNWMDIGLQNDIHGLNSSIGSLFIRGAGSGLWTYGDGSQFINITNSSLIDGTNGTEATITLNTATGVENFYLGSAGATGTPDYTFTNATLPSTQFGLYAGASVFNGDTPSGDTVPANFPVTSFSVTDTPLIVPEPSSDALFILGGLAMFGFWMRRRLTN